MGAFLVDKIIKAWYNTIMNYQHGQIWMDRKVPDKAAFVIGEKDGYVWYSMITIVEPHPHRDGILGPEVKWTKAKADAFEKRYEMTKHPVRQGVFWKSKATGQMVCIHGVNDNGHSSVVVYFLTQRMTIEDFMCYYEPCSAMEQAQFIVDNIKRPDPPEKTRIESIEDELD